MGKRREERQPIRLPATAWYMLEDGTLAVDHIRTVELSRMGARITGLKHSVSAGLMLSIQQGNSTGRFRIVWVGEEGTDREGQAGIECVEIGQAVNRTVLQVDDNSFDRERRHGALQRSGYDVVSPPSTHEAFEVLETRLVDVVMLGYPPRACICEHHVQLCAFVGVRCRGNMGYLEQRRRLRVGSDPESIGGRDGVHRQHRSHRRHLFWMDLH